MVKPNHSNDLAGGGSPEQIPSPPRSLQHLALATPSGGQRAWARMMWFIRSPHGQALGRGQGAGGVWSANAKCRAQHSWPKRSLGFQSPLRTPGQAPGLLRVPGAVSVRTPAHPGRAKVWIEVW